MKKTIIFTLLVILAGSVTLTAQTKKRTTRKRAAKQSASTAAPKPDSTANPASSMVFDPIGVDTSKRLAIVPDSDDGYYKSVVMTKARPFPILEPDKNNIKFFHRYWRDMDLKDPKNQKFNSPGATLIEAILKGIKDGKITPYDVSDPTPRKPTDFGNPVAMDIGFTVPLTFSQLMGRLQSKAPVDSFNANGEKVGSKMVLNDFSPDKVVGYRIKEDVYLDKRREKVETRIIGLAPLIRLTLTNGDTVGTQPVCWLKFSQCRAIFATMDLSDPDKNLYDVSMDDMFLQRQFNAKITEESNPLGRRIKDYITDPIEQDKESMRIEKKLADYKNNLWKYQTSGNVIVTTSQPVGKIKSSKKKKFNPAAAADTTAPGN